MRPRGRRSRPALALTAADGNHRRVVRFEGDLEGLDPERAISSIPDGLEVDFDLGSIERITGLGACRILDLGAAVEARGQSVRMIPGSPEKRRLLALYAQPFPAYEPDAVPPALDRLVLGLRDAQESGLRGTLLVLRTLTAVLRQVVGIDRRRGDAVLAGVARMGLHAVPLVALITSLVGIILALQAAPLMRMWGQELRIADLVGLSVTKEIGPLLVAILVAGRSGAALAAEIATMRVSEEIDALEVMGVSPVSYLVGPRLRALVIVVPALTLLADALGILGGFAVGVLLLDLSPIAYWRQTQAAIEVQFVLASLLKGALFGIVIALVAAHQGFSTRGGAAAVGRATTRAVVQSVLWIILVDTVFTGVQTAMDW